MINAISLKLKNKLIIQIKEKKKLSYVTSHKYIMSDQIFQ